MDFDGVIADTWDIAHRVGQMFCARLTPALHRKQFEGNIYEADDSIRQEDHGPECNHGLDWWGAYVPMFEQEGRPFPGALEAISRLADSYSLTVISSTISDPIRSFLERNSAQVYFDDVMGGDVNPSKVEKIRMVLAKHGAEPKDCIFVTDTLGDIKEAAHHGIGAIACAWGFHTRETLQRGVPFRIIESPTELVDAVDDYFAYARS